MTPYSDRICARRVSVVRRMRGCAVGFPVFKVGDNKLLAMMTHRATECETTAPFHSSESERRVRGPFRAAAKSLQLSV